MRIVPLRQSPGTAEPPTKSGVTSRGLQAFATTMLGKSNLSPSMMTIIRSGQVTWISQSQPPEQQNMYIIDAG
jgi:hypothetical protein